MMSKQSCSSCSCFARTPRNYGMNMGTGGHVPEAAWSMSSVLTALPESPTHYATEFSSPRNQSSGITHGDNNNNNKCSICFSDIDEWLEHANKFCKPSNSRSNHLTATVDLRGNASPEEEVDICNNTFLTAPENELYNITLPSIREESPVLQGHTITRLSCIYGHAPSPSNERRTLLSGTKPHAAQLWSDETTRKKHEAERNRARARAKHDQLVNRMRRKDTAIDNWELKQTRRAMDEMDKIQNKLRQQTLRRFQQLQTFETKSPTAHSFWGSRLPLC